MTEGTGARHGWRSGSKIVQTIIEALAWLVLAGGVAGAVLTHRHVGALPAVVCGIGGVLWWGALLTAVQILDHLAAIRAAIEAPAGERTR
jgi:hypothetical protein